MAWPAAVKSGHHTLLWGLDPQGGYSWPLGKDGSSPPAHQLAVSSRRHPTELVVDTTWPRLSLLPPDKSLRGPTIGLNRIGHQRRPARRPLYYTFVAIAIFLARA